MRPSPRHYLLIVLAPLALLVTGSALLNLWIDPVDTFRDQRLTTRAYALNALLAELEIPAESEAEIDAFLLGTSRTHWGNDTRNNPAVINLGIDGSTDRMIDNLLVGLLQTSTRPHVYFVDTMGARDGLNEVLEGRTLRHLVSGGTTKQSLRQIAEEILRPPTPDTDSSTNNTPPPEPPHGDPKRDQGKVEYLRKSLPIQPHTRATIERRIQHLKELPVPHHALVVFYDGPHSPTSLADPTILNALHARTRLWRQVMAENNAAPSRTLDLSTADAEGPKVTLTYVSYATPADWGESVTPEVWRKENWWDPLHFKPITGQRLLDRLMTFAAETR